MCVCGLARKQRYESEPTHAGGSSEPLWTLVFHGGAQLGSRRGHQRGLSASAARSTTRFTMYCAHVGGERPNRTPTGMLRGSTLAGCVRTWTHAPRGAPAHQSLPQPLRADAQRQSSEESKTHTTTAAARGRRTRRGDSLFRKLMCYRPTTGSLLRSSRPRQARSGS